MPVFGASAALKLQLNWTPSAPSIKVFLFSASVTGFRVLFNDISTQDAGWQLACEAESLCTYSFEKCVSFAQQRR
jgi:hypothetical protein